MSDSTRTRPAHLQWRLLCLVALGGMLGTAAREGLSLAFPPVHDIPFSIAAINVTGAFLLGFLLQSLSIGARREPQGRRNLRLFVGTGVLGGYTTYSALATDTVLLAGTSPIAGVGYALGTVVLGALGTMAGIALASRVFHPNRVLGATADSEGDAN